MRTPATLLALLLLTACSGREAETAPSPGRAEQGDWVQFYSRESDQGAQQYYYDRAQLQQRDNHVLARWKILGTGGATTLYVIDIACRESTFTERGTVQIDRAGQTREVPRGELFVDRPIAADTSTARFRQMFCR